MAALSTVPYALIVEDDPMIMMDACDIVKAAGFRSFEAETGDAAKLLLEQHAEYIVLVFTDVEMPGSTTGFELAHHVFQRWPEIAIVVASGRVQPQPGDMPDGARFIAKPFSADTVHFHLREILPDHKQPTPLKRPV